MIWTRLRWKCCTLRLVSVGTGYLPEVQGKRVATSTQKTKLYGQDSLGGAADLNWGSCQPAWSWLKGATRQPEEFTLCLHFPSFLWYSVSVSSCLHQTKATGQGSCLNQCKIISSSRHRAEWEKVVRVKSDSSYCKR